MKGKNRTQSMLSAGLALLVLAIAVVANLLIARLPDASLKFDLTSSAIYSFDRQTEEMLESMDTDVTIYYLVEDGNENVTVSEVLARYESAGARIQVERIDPTLYPTFAERYTEEALPAGSMIFVSEKRHTALSAEALYEYMQDHVTGDTSLYFDGEDQITTAIHYVITDAMPLLYTITGHGEDAIPAELLPLIERSSIEIAPLDLLQAGGVPKTDRKACVLLLSPASDLSAAEADHLLAYLEGGGSMIVVSDIAEAAMPNLARVLDSYGLALEEGVVVEGDPARHLAGYPQYLFPEIAAHPITDPMIEASYRVMLPLSQGLRETEDHRESVFVHPLLTTSADAYGKADVFELTTLDEEIGDTKGPFGLAYLATERNAGRTTNLIAFSTGWFLQPEIDAYVSGANYTLFVNALSYLVGIESGISIYAKDVTDVYLDLTSASVKPLLMLFVGIIPAIPLVLGAIVTYRRRRR